MQLSSLVENMSRIRPIQQLFKPLLSTCEVPTGVTSFRLQNSSRLTSLDNATMTEAALRRIQVFPSQLVTDLRGQKIRN